MQRSELHLKITYRSSKSLPLWHQIPKRSSHPEAAVEEDRMAEGISYFGGVEEEEADPTWWRR
jgi:hypothetical protein